MKVLVVHNSYRSKFPSGENVVVADEAVGLRAAGIDVRTYIRSSDEFSSMRWTDRAIALSSPLTGWASKQELQEVIEHQRPDVIHLHNPYPLISPRLITWCRDARVPIVATVHNFRLRCMNGLMFRKGEICTRCEQSFTPLPGVLRGCYRGSLAQSAVMGTGLLIHQKTWQTVTRFIAVSEFVADRLLSWGVDAHQITVKPNPVADPGPPTAPGSGFLFAGRLSEEKGIRLLLDSWKASGLAGRERLVIAGDGPLADLVRANATPESGIEFVGKLSPVKLAAYRQNTAVGVMSSTCYEAHPSVAESFSHQRPVVAPRVGSFEQIVDHTVGWTATPSVRGFARALLEATDRKEIEKRGSSARQRFEKKYDSTIVTAKLIKIYQLAVEAACSK